MTLISQAAEEVRSGSLGEPSRVAVQVLVGASRSSGLPTKGTATRASAIDCQRPFLAGDPAYAEVFNILEGCTRDAVALIAHRCSVVRRIATDGTVIPFRERRREPHMQIAAACTQHLTALLRLTNIQRRILEHRGQVSLGRTFDVLAIGRAA